MSVVRENGNEKFMIEVRVESESVITEWIYKLVYVYKMGVP